MPRVGVPEAVTSSVLAARAPSRSARHAVRARYNAARSCCETLVAVLRRARRSCVAGVLLRDHAEPRTEEEGVGRDTSAERRPDLTLAIDDAIELAPPRCLHAQHLDEPLTGVFAVSRPELVEGSLSIRCSAYSRTSRDRRLAVLSEERALMRSSRRREHDLLRARARRARLAFAREPSRHTARAKASNGGCVHQLQPALAQPRKRCTARAPRPTARRPARRARRSSPGADRAWDSSGSRARSAPARRRTRRAGRCGSGGSAQSVASDASESPNAGLPACAAANRAETDRRRSRAAPARRARAGRRRRWYRPTSRPECRGRATPLRRRSTLRTERKITAIRSGASPAASHSRDAFGDERRFVGRRRKSLHVEPRHPKIAA